MMMNLSKEEKTFPCIIYFPAIKIVHVPECVDKFELRNRNIYIYIFETK